MKKLLIFSLILINIIFSSKADDIRDFQIEGMSIGDSLLDFFDEKEIKNNYIFVENSRKYYAVLVLSEKNNQYKSAVKKLNDYYGMHIYVDPNDKKYIIKGLEAMLDFRNNFSECFNKKEEIEKSIDQILPNAKKVIKNAAHEYDKSNNSMVYTTYIRINPNSKYYQLKIQCFDWSKEMGFIDHFRLSLLNDDVTEDINKSYK
tara:strand:+ start:300 stop:908 length:609 start_codon:yes stop_codon:yes gene_type:complete